MGSCFCKAKAQVSAECGNFHSQTSSTMSEGDSAMKQPQPSDIDVIRRLILEMLHYISTVPGGGEDASSEPLLKINSMAESDEGWCNVVTALMEIIPSHDPLGPSALTIVFDDCPLPAKDTVVSFTRNLNLEKSRCEMAYADDECVRYERNILFILGCIAEKFAGSNCVEVLTDDVILYLVTFLIDEKNPSLVLPALIALEKFARTTENKVSIEKCLNGQLLHPLLPLELHHNSQDYRWREVGFCAKWALDNVFIMDGRRFSFETVHMGDIHTMLNYRDGSEYLKISPDGLEARCDSHSFESVRGTFQVDAQCWYYEAEIITAGVMQVGWATKKSSFQNHEGYGVGDDSFSLAYDGCRRLLWHGAVPTEVQNVPNWQPGDILGCLIDLDRQEAIFLLNGQRLPVCTDIFKNTRVNWIESSERCSEGFYAAASFMAHQQCRFNFGNQEFRYPPLDRVFRDMNDYGILTNEEKKVIPRRVIMEQIRLEDRVMERRCSICLDEVGNYGLEPCLHGGFCIKCVKMLELCPLCRSNVREYYILAL